MTRLETWEAVSTMTAPLTGARLDASTEVTVTSEPLARRHSSFGRRLSAVFGVIGIVLFVPLYIMALPVALLWRAILETVVWRREPKRIATDSSNDTAAPRWFVWK